MTQKFPFKLIFFLIGFSIFILIILEADLTNLINRLEEVTFFEGLVLLVVYCLYFAADSISWLYALPSSKLNFYWMRRLFLIRMVGEAYNNITPAASMGGEPLKAWLLKVNHGVSYTESTAGLIISKTTSLISLIAILVVTLALAFFHPSLLRGELASATLLVFGTLLLVYVIVKLQRNNVLTKIFKKLEDKSKLVRGLGLFRLASEVDQKFNNFYSKHRQQLFFSTIFAGLNWLLGIVEIYLIFYFIGYPISFSEAWILESLIQTVKMLTFFVPAAIGTQEGAFFFGAIVLLGASAPGIVAAIVRRVRELFWIGLSLLIVPFMRNIPKKIGEKGH